MSEWHYKEADRLYQALGGKLPKKGYVAFQAGFGASGLPHIGTFCEIIRPNFVRKAFEEKYNMPTKLIVFSDDMDALRKVPKNIPNQDLLSQYLGCPLTSVPDPFGVYQSFGEYNNAMMRKFLDTLDIDYDFRSATESYKSGAFNDGIRMIAKRESDIKEIILPTISEERRATYSPIMPVDNNKVLQESISVIDGDRVKYCDKVISYLDGNCKMQWRADWALRLFVFDVDYEMHGKDLIDSMASVKKILKVLGCKPPVTMFFELFLDEKGAKISKSTGNSLSLDEMVRYFPLDVNRFFMYVKPTTAKKLSFGTMIDYSDRYISEINKNGEPVSYINDKYFDMQGITYSLVVRLAYTTKVKSVDNLVEFIRRYKPNLTMNSLLEEVIKKALAYTQEIYKPDLLDYMPTDDEYAALKVMLFKLNAMDDNADANSIQNTLYSVGRDHFGNIKGFFQCIYKVAFDSLSGPRLGGFIQIYGLREFCNLIEQKIANFQ